MKIRTLTKEDAAEYGRVVASAYFRNPVTTQSWLAGTPPGHGLGAFENRELVSVLTIAPFQCAFGGAWVSMGGIGGVGTRADRQGRGAAGSLLRASLTHMRKLGYPVSILYPFSYRYYGKFGWELAGVRLELQHLAPSDLRSYDEHQQVDMATSSDIAAMTRCYNDYALLHNCMAKRTAAGMRTKYREWIEKSCQVYVVRSGRAISGWAVLSRESEGFSAAVRVRELTAVDNRSMRAIIGFLSRSPKMVHELALSLPNDLTILEHLTEPRAELRVRDLFQIRLVDVAKALAARGYRETADATVVFRVHDETASWNEGTWELAVRNGRPGVRSVQGDPDIELDQRRLAQLYSGHLRAADVGHCDDVRVTGSDTVRKLDLLFDRRDPHLYEQF